MYPVGLIFSFPYIDNDMKKKESAINKVSKNMTLNLALVVTPVLSCKMDL